MADDEDVLGNPLSIEDEQYDIVHEAPMAGVVILPTLDEARETARALVEHGLGATVAPVDEPAGFEVRVLPDEAHRAAELLDLAAHDPGEPTGGHAAPGFGLVHDLGDEPGAPGDRPPIPWRSLLLIWLAAMILLPLAAGVGTYLLSR